MPMRHIFISFNFMRSTEGDLLFRKDVEKFRDQIGDLARIFYLDDEGRNVPSKVVGSMFSALHSDLFGLLAKDYEDE